MAGLQVSHVNFLHLLFNGSALWSLGMVEALGAAAGYGTAYYLQTSLLLLVLSGAVRAPCSALNPAWPSTLARSLTLRGFSSRPHSPCWYSLERCGPPWYALNPVWHVTPPP